SRRRRREAQSTQPPSHHPNGPRSAADPPLPAGRVPTRASTALPRPRPQSSEAQREAHSSSDLGDARPPPHHGPPSGPAQPSNQAVERAPALARRRRASFVSTRAAERDVTRYRAGVSDSILRIHATDADF